MKLAATISGALLLSACATSTSTYLPDGSRGHSIVCSGSALSWAQCEQKAGEICKDAGYDLLSKSSDSNASVAGGQFGLFGNSSNSRSMLIKCRGDADQAKPVKPRSTRKPGNPAMN